VSGGYNTWGGGGAVGGGGMDVGRREAWGWERERWGRVGLAGWTADAWVLGCIVYMAIPRLPCNRLSVCPCNTSCGPQSSQRIH
jgi:hypothetical protein